ncbi:MAG: hypothetical protein ACRCVT_05720 [Leadbetterella sp.]
MKKSISTFAFILFSVCVFGQSISLVPNGIEQEITNYGSTPQIVGRRSGGTATSPTATPSGASLLTIGAKGYAGSSFSPITSSSISFIASQPFTFTSISNFALGTNIAFSTISNNGTALTEKMRVNHDGKIGIGTNSPIAKLHVKEGPSGVTPSVYSNLFVESDNTNYISIAAPNDKEVGILFEKPSQTSIKGGIIYHPDNSMRFYTNSGTKMTISDNGNVGIGTASPSSRLHVNGSILGANITGSGTVSGASIAFRDRIVVTAANPMPCSNPDPNFFASRVHFGGGGDLILEDIPASFNHLGIIFCTVSLQTSLLIKHNVSPTCNGGNNGNIYTNTGFDVWILSGGGAVLMYDESADAWRLISRAD